MKTMPSAIPVKALAGVTFMVLSGCQSVSGPVARSVEPVSGYGQMRGVPEAGVEPMAGQYANAYAAGYVQQLQSSQEASNMAFKERLERIERALLKLDRRMQLVERNELGRMSGAVDSATEGRTVGNMSELDQGANLAEVDTAPHRKADSIQPERVAFADRGEIVGGETVIGYREGFTPVSQRDGSMPLVKSPLQAGGRMVAGLPSLADPLGQAPGRTLAPAGNVAIWTIKYEPSKVWPDRSQLPSSHSIVDILRNKSTATVFARGANTATPEFQERVKAVSRYLSKVSSLETLPIAAIPSPALDNNTIEILVTQ